MDGRERREEEERGGRDGRVVGWRGGGVEGTPVQRIRVTVTPAKHTVVS